MKNTMPKFTCAFLLAVSVIKDVTLDEIDRLLQDSNLFWRWANRSWV
jgi:hypothetical protein